MRIKKGQIEFLKQIIGSALPGASVFLFGFRVFDDLKGGDIDILALVPIYSNPIMFVRIYVIAGLSI